MFGEKKSKEEKIASVPSHDVLEKCCRNHESSPPSVGVADSKHFYLFQNIDGMNANSAIGGAWKGNRMFLISITNKQWDWDCI
ncbi:hypothetical protein NPIL_634701 [Nephila pilipes]|uniref:Uncharacterized protein n=1 Tax=Nephila pilipes TaxID=299642 RepID=A0A8X6TT66_NEPPI|nr:hypothetical protein NPIL_634701 [Nephila pilipes]